MIKKGLLKMKKSLAVILSAAMVLSSLTIPAYAEEITDEAVEASAYDAADEAIDDSAIEEEVIEEQAEEAISAAEEVVGDEAEVISELTNNEANNDGADSTQEWTAEEMFTEWDPNSATVVEFTDDKYELPGTTYFYVKRIGTTTAVLPKTSIKCIQVEGSGGSWVEFVTSSQSELTFECTSSGKNKITDYGVYKVNDGVDELINNSTGTVENATKSDIKTVGPITLVDAGKYKIRVIDNATNNNNLRIQSLKVIESGSSTEPPVTTPHKITVAENDGVKEVDFGDTDESAVLENDEVSFTVSTVRGKTVSKVEKKEGENGTNEEITAESDGSYKLTMPGDDVTITVTTEAATGYKATFEKGTASVSVNGETDIEVVSGSTEIYEGETVVYTPGAADTGKEIKEVKVSYENNNEKKYVENVIEEDGKYVFTMPEANVTITPEYKDIDYSISVNGTNAATAVVTGAAVTVKVKDKDASGDAVAYSGTNKAHYNGTIEVKATADTGYIVKSVTAAYATKTEEIEIADDGTFTLAQADDVNVTIDVVATKELTVEDDGVKITYKWDAADTTEDAKKVTPESKKAAIPVGVTVYAAKDAAFDAVPTVVKEGDTKGTPAALAADSANNTYSFVMPDKNASLYTTAYTVTIANGTADGVTVKTIVNGADGAAIEKTGSAKFTQGAEVTFYATATGDVVVTEVKADNNLELTAATAPATADNAKAYSFVVANQNVVLTVTTKAAVAITLADGSDAFATLSNTKQAAGGRVTITPNADYVITAVEVAGTAEADKKKILEAKQVEGKDEWEFTLPGEDAYAVTVTVTAHKEFAVTFEEGEFTVSTEDGNAVVSGNKVAEGRKLTVSANTGYVLKSVKVGSAQAQTISSNAPDRTTYTTAAINAAAEIKVETAKIAAISITGADATGVKSVSINGAASAGDQVIAVGDTFTLAYTAADDYEVNAQVTGATESGSTGVYTVTDAAVTITITVTENEYTVTAKGNITVSPSKAKKGTTVTISPATDYEITSAPVVKEQGGSRTISVNAAGDNYTFTLANYNVTVTAETVKKETEQPAPVSANVITKADGVVSWVAADHAGDSIAANGTVKYGKITLTSGKTSAIDIADPFNTQTGKTAFTFTTEGNTIISVNWASRASSGTVPTRSLKINDKVVDSSSSTDMQSYTGKYSEGGEFVIQGSDPISIWSITIQVVDSGEKYAITLTGDNVTADKAQAEEGEDVTLTAAEGYLIKGVTVNGEAVTDIAEAGVATYSFKMPGQAAKVVVATEEKPAEEITDLTGYTVKYALNASDLEQTQDNYLTTGAVGSKLITADKAETTPDMFTLVTEKLRTRIPSDFPADGLSATLINKEKRVFKQFINANASAQKITFTAPEDGYVELLGASNQNAEGAISFKHGDVTGTLTVTAGGTPEERGVQQKTFEVKKDEACEIEMANKTNLYMAAFYVKGDGTDPEDKDKDKDTDTGSTDKTDDNTPETASGNDILTNGVNEEQAAEQNADLVSKLGKKADSKVDVYQAKGDTVSTNLTLKKGKVKEVKVNSLEAGKLNKVTLNTKVKVSVGTGWKVSANKADGGQDTRLTKFAGKVEKAAGKKGVVVLKKVKGADPYVLTLTKSDNTVLQITVVDVYFDKMIKKQVLSAKAVSENAVSENAAVLDVTKDQGFAVTASANTITIGTLPAKNRFLSGVWTIGAGKNAKNIPVGGIATKVPVNKKLTAYAWVNKDGTLTVAPGSAQKGSIKITYSLNGKTYKTAVKIK